MSDSGFFQGTVGSSVDSIREDRVVERVLARPSNLVNKTLTARGSISENVVLGKVNSISLGHTTLVHRVLIATRDCPRVVGLVPATGNRHGGG